MRKLVEESGLLIDDIGVTTTFRGIRETVHPAKYAAFYDSRECLLEILNTTWIEKNKKDALEAAGRYQRLEVAAICLELGAMPTRRFFYSLLRPAPGMKREDRDFDRLIRRMKKSLQDFDFEKYDFDILNVLRSDYFNSLGLFIALYDPKPLGEDLYSSLTPNDKYLLDSEYKEAEKIKKTMEAAKK